MPTVPPYTYTGPIDHTLPPHLPNLHNKSVIITGGANGIGAILVRTFTQHASFVTFCDTDSTRGLALQHELGTSHCQFIPCDIRSWPDQVAVFDAAITNSPSQSVDIVIANAGISRSSTDSLWDLDDPEGEPVKPDLRIVDVNVYGTLYTWKLAVHYVRKNGGGGGGDGKGERERCFVIMGSMVTWIDSPANWQYTLTKSGLHGLMRTARRNSHEQNIRINYVAPCFIQSAIRSEEYARWLVEQGVEFAEPEDVAACCVRIACDPEIHGRSLMVVPKTQAKEGFMDVNMDDFVEEGYFKRMQDTQLRVIKDKWVVGEKAQGRS